MKGVPDVAWIVCVIEVLTASEHRKYYKPPVSSRGFKCVLAKKKIERSQAGNKLTSKLI